MTKQNLKILPERKRRQVSCISTYEEKFKEIEDLLDSFNNGPPLPLLSYAPIFLVTNIEVITKELIAKLVDGGDKQFLTNSYKLLEPKNALNIEGLKLLHGQNITFGDIVSSLISVGSMENITTHMNVLLGKEQFKEILSKESVTDNIKIINNINNNFKALHSLFKLRHQIVHENSQLSINFDSIKVYIDETRQFLKAFISYISKSVDPPNYQQGINEFVGKRSLTVEVRIKELIDEIILSLQNNQDNTFQKIKKLKEAQSLWKKFVNKIAEFECFDEEGGSIYSTLFSSCKISFNQLILDELERRYSEENLNK
ncbi:HEPN domain-containing protein [Legionella sp. WA2022007384]